MYYYTRHIGDYRRDCGHLTMLEHGAYQALLDAYYASEKPLPDSDVERLAGARTPDERQAVRAVLKDFFKLDGDAWRQSRCDETIAAYHHQAKVNRENGGKGGPKAWKRNATHPVTESVTHSVTHSVTGSDTQPGTHGLTETLPTTLGNHKPITNNHSEIDKSISGAAAPSGGNSPETSDPRKQLWALGVTILGDKNRSLIGQAVKRVGEERVAQAIGHMATESMADPKAWFVKATTPKERGAVW